MTGCYVWSFVQSARFWIIIWSILIWYILKVLVDRNCFLWKYVFFLPMLIIVYGRVKAGKLIQALMNIVVLWTTNSGFEAFFGLLQVGERSISVDDLLICRGKSKEATDMWEKWWNYITRKIESEDLRGMRNMLNQCIHQIKDEAKWEECNSEQVNMTERIKDKSWRTKHRLRRRKDHMGRKGNKPNLVMSEILTKQSRKKSGCWGKGKGWRIHLTWPDIYNAVI